MTLYDQEKLIVEMKYQLHLVKNSLTLGNVSKEDIDYLVVVLDEALIGLEMIQEGV